MIYIDAFYGARTILSLQTNEKLCVQVFLGLCISMGIGDVEAAMICSSGFEPGLFHAICSIRIFLQVSEDRLLLIVDGA
jgi:hypothetical protein